MKNKWNGSHKGFESQMQYRRAVLTAIVNHFSDGIGQQVAITLRDKFEREGDLTPCELEILEDILAAEPPLPRAPDGCTLH